MRGVLPALVGLRLLLLPVWPPAPVVQAVALVVAVAVAVPVLGGSRRWWWGTRGRSQKYQITQRLRGWRRGGRR